jgi:predicted GNAT superfamily acetyltransferase
MSLDADDRPRTFATARPTVVADFADATCRTFSSADEMQACVALQHEIWGADFADAVPASLLRVATSIGGLAVGAFAGDGTMLGFVFSLIGQRTGEAIHWSHMLAVRETARGLGIARKLKEFQLAELARRGIARVFWTFDPLQARNAHLNLNRLGARVIDYVANMYGITQSPLHHGLATDRLVVVCETRAGRVDGSTRSTVPAGSPVLTPFPRPGDTRLDEGARGVTTVLIEVPPDLQELGAGEPEAAATWRMATRSHFLWALREGYHVTDLRRDPLKARAFYVLVQNIDRSDA